MNEENSSPVIIVENLDGTPVSPEGLTFLEAMKAIIEGKVVTRKEWNNSDIFCLMKSSLLTIHNEKGFHSWIISDGDMSATDWIRII